ncbi:hypothetical protein Sme01_56620 [Sphaerisporangium melleum]|uniref:Septum formation initiator n=1 Tax=Sphaerisporangium melleum TaxID=321316 RepID=A0A917RGL3_9ACTN|nr:hypothetical protein [Sphaerisporangium melleum]GGL05596.1 hypothetical protein GCM10007964_54810 [Sphaerisporangium melleum]GII73186.1 hypothetical protein Sme01_56620 [Sphaerisporangium melleum]
MKRGPLLATLGWLAAATFTTGTTTWAIALLGQGLSEPVVSPMSAAQLTQALATATAAPVPPATTSPEGSASPSATARSGRVFTTQGGTVVAACVAGRPTLQAWSPAQGYQVDDVEDRSGHLVSVEFESENTKIEVRITCAADLPSVTTRVERD